MISCDFAPNEQLDDAILSLKLLFLPWRWQKGNEMILAKNQILKLLSQPHHLDHDREKMVKLFLTGRSALYYLLKSLNLPKNSEIIIQGFTCEAVVLPILANNLRPIYADIENQSFSLDPIDTEKKITNRTKVIILQHSFGIPPKYHDTIISLVKQHHLLLIEDIAHGFNNVALKQLNNNSIYLMSFGRSKAISSVYGGAIVTNNQQITQKLKKIEKELLFSSRLFVIRTLLYKPLSYLIKSTYDIYLGRILHKIINLLKVLPSEITTKEKNGDYNPFFDKVYPNALAILLLHQLKKFDQIQQQRAKICAIYNNQFSNFEFRISNFPLPRYPLLVKNRTELIQDAKKYHLFLGQWYSQPVAPKGLDLIKVGYKMGSCPTAEEVCQQIINLPTLIKTEEANKIIKTFNDVASL